MRLQLTIVQAVALCASLVPTAALADGRAATWLSVYSDNDSLTVVSPQVAVRAPLGEKYHVEASYDVDVISAATIDVVTAASPRGYHEERHGVLVGGTYEPNAGTVFNLRYISSFERDYHSHAAAVSASNEWLDRRLTTRLDARFTKDRVGRSGDDESLWHDLTTMVVGATVAYVMDRRTVGQIAYELQRRDGFQSSPYRFVDVGWMDGTVVSVAEAVPDERTRHAISAGVRRAIGSAWFASASYRLYRDSWEILSHTVSGDVQRAINKRVLVGANVRGYYQGDASFYQPEYQSAVGSFPDLRSSDKSHSRSKSLLAGVRAEVMFNWSNVFSALRAVAKVEVYDQRFDNLPRLDGRRAIIGSMGVSAEF